jgi:hypothetical protein
LLVFLHDLRILYFPITTLHLFLTLLSLYLAITAVHQHTINRITSHGAGSINCLLAHY